MFQLKNYTNKNILTKISKFIQLIAHVNFKINDKNIFFIRSTYY